MGTFSTLQRETGTCTLPLVYHLHIFAYLFTTYNCLPVYHIKSTGVYSWNWELPLRREQVINCAKTPPPELTRQQEALAAATAAAAAAAAVTAGATPDTIPSLPVVARMASLLGKRQHQQVAALPSLPVGPQAMLVAPIARDTEGGMLTAESLANPAKLSAAEGIMDESVGGLDRFWSCMVCSSSLAPSPAQLKADPQVVAGQSCVQLAAVLQQTAVLSWFLCS